MDCKHEQIRCTDDKFFCLICGKEIPNPFDVQEEPQEEKKPRTRKKKEVTE